MTLACILFYSFVLSDMAYGDIKAFPPKYSYWIQTTSE